MHKALFLMALAACAHTEHCCRHCCSTEPCGKSGPGTPAETNARKGATPPGASVSWVGGGKPSRPFSFAASRHRLSAWLTGTLRAMRVPALRVPKFAARSCGELCRRPATGLAQMQAFLGNFGGVSGGFPRRPVCSTNPSPRAARCLTNKGCRAGLGSGILSART
jgi:hypothetical protein